MTAFRTYLVLLAKFGEKGGKRGTFVQKVLDIGKSKNAGGF